MIHSLLRLPDRRRAFTARHRTRAWKFGLVGLTGVVVNTAAVALLTDFIGFHYVIGVILGTQVSTASNFVFTDRWVFSDRWDPAAAGRRFASFWMVNNGALAVRSPLVVMLTSGLGVHYLVSNLLSLLVVFVARYVASDAWIWRAASVELGA